MPDMRELFPVLARGGGRWTGEYRFVDPAGTLLDQYRVDTISDFPEDGSADYRLRTHNIWPDGRESRAELLADYRNGRLEWRNKLVGWMAEIDEHTIYLTFSYASDPSIRVCEMIQVSPDGQHRARTWHWFRDGILYQTTLTREERAV
ncbi:MAG: hypothetical protein QM690_10140 [Sphingobium sp.]